ncbi:MAG: bifunctional precorrin-2 dehydrogenase/sirohydrochlorin ferrochelatase [Lentisphaerae bacterium]|nr:bifunctional precorrin-2 dehydrogenase/sirohydrochlorin ferrochelatase [Lentisphaerota bacterium]
MRKHQEERPILPVSLLVAGRPCLVVGGGTIAARKVAHLLDAEAKVTVVSPDTVDELATLAGDKRIHHLAREFTPSDVDGQHLVFAATDSEDVNREVLESCRSRGALCSAIDSNWPDGDLVLPAVCRKAGLIVSVATGGRSCRLARTVKDRIAGMMEEMANEGDS